jgi:hypothetical protein
MATESDSPNTGALATIAAVGALAMIGISFAVTALVRREVGEEVSEKGAAANVRPYRELTQKQREVLSAPASWADKGKQTVSIPLEQAMQLTVNDIRRNPNLATRMKPPPDAGAAEQDAGAAVQDTTDGAAPTAEGAEAGSAPPGQGPAAPTGQTEGAPQGVSPAAPQGGYGTAKPAAPTPAAPAPAGASPTEQPPQNAP